MTMMWGNQLNADSLQKIQNIVNGFKSYPAYSKYTIKSYVYDVRQDIHAIEILLGNNCINLFLFYPNSSGKIESIALYVSNLIGHYNAMRSSMMVFGMKIISIDKECGMSDFLDIYIEY